MQSIRTNTTGTLLNRRVPLCLISWISGIPVDVLFFCFMVALFNLPLFFEGNAANFIYTTATLRSGEWWRILTHPFIHVSWYHLALDGIAFFMLYQQLLHKPIFFRLSLFCLCLTGSLTGAIIETGGGVTQGLCGLSGIGHGLMAFIAIENCTRSRVEKYLGIISLVILCIKSYYEWITGIPFLYFLHFGNIGNPVLASHLGGVIAGVGLGLVTIRKPSLAQ